MSHNISLPRHRYVWVVPSFVLRDPLRQALVPAVWIGVSVTAGRSIGCHVLLDNGAVVVDLPLHALRGAFAEWEPLALDELVSWDCYGWSAEAWEPPYLSGLACTVLSDDHKWMVDRATMWFCIDHIQDGYSLAPEQHKHLWIVIRTPAGGRIGEKGSHAWIAQGIASLGRVYISCAEIQASIFEIRRKRPANRGAIMGKGNELGDTVGIDDV